MPQITNLTVKKFDGTTDIVYTALTGAAGRDQPALWRASTVSAVPNNCPSLKMSSKSNSAGTTRIVTLDYDYPILATAGDVQVVNGHQKISVTVPVLQGQDWTQTREGVVQGLNLLAQALIRSSILEGYAPRS